MGNIAKSLSNLFSRAAFQLFTQTSGQGISRRPISRRGLLCASLVLPAILCGQAAAPGPSDSAEPIFSSEARYVPLNVTVTDKGDHLVTNLQESEFQVFENNVLQPIKVFKHEDVPV